MTQTEKNSIYQHFLSAVVKGGLKPIVDVAYSYFKRPLLIFDPDFHKLVQWPKKPIGDPIFDGLLSYSTVPSDIMAKYLADFTDTPWIDGEIHFFDWGSMENFPRLSKSVIIDGQIAALCSVICPDKTYSEDDVEILKVYIDALQMEFSQRLNYSVLNEPLLQSFYGVLMEGEPDAIRFYHDLLEQNRILLSSKYCVVAAKPILKVSNLVIIDMCNRIRQSDTHMHIIPGGEFLYILYDDIPKAHLYSEIIDRLRNDSVFAESKFVLGVSNIFDNIEDFDIYRYQAERAIAVNSSKSDSLYRYADSVIADILSYAKESMPAQIYANPTIQALEQLDEKKNSEYSDTLRAYLVNCCDSSATCEALHLHRNTLAYRLDKIESICGIDLSDTDTQIELLIGYMMKKV